MLNGVRRVLKGVADGDVLLDSDFRHLGRRKRRGWVVGGAMEVKFFFFFGWFLVRYFFFGSIEWI